MRTLLLFLFTLPVLAAITGPVDHGAAGATSGSSDVTVTLNTSSCAAPCAIYVAVASLAGSSYTVTASPAVTFTALTAETSSAGSVTETIWCAAAVTPNASQGITVNVGGTNVYASIAARAYGGVQTSCTPASSAGTSVTGAPYQFGSLSVSSGHLLLSAMGWNPLSGVPTVDTGDTPDGVAFSPGVHFGVALSAIIASSSGSQDPTWQPFAGNDAAGTNAVFVPGSVGVLSSGVKRRILN